MLATFENAAKELPEPGAISEVVTTKYGYHVIQLIGREPGRQKTFEEVKPELMKTLEKDHGERYRREHVDQLRSMKLDANPPWSRS
jgi:parvulin-like peptidyl-prolyl isomerase